MDIYTTMDDYKLLFISFEAGGGGHKLGRVLACLPHVYWYSHPNNGKHPWNVHTTKFKIYNRRISKNHFDRLVGDQMLPAPWDYVKHLYPNKQKYMEQFKEKFLEIDPPKDKYLLYCTHMVPQEIIEDFPHSKIINLVTDPVVTSERYMRTTAFFLPTRSKITIRDTWALSNKGTLYIEDYHDEYFYEVRDKITRNINRRKQAFHPNVLSIYSKDYKTIKDFIRVH
jgi:hypothetical protein